MMDIQTRCPNTQAIITMAHNFMLLLLRDTDLEVMTIDTQIIQESQSTEVTDIETCDRTRMTI